MRKKYIQKVQNTATDFEEWVEFVPTEWGERPKKYQLLSAWVEDGERTRAYYYIGDDTVLCHSPSPTWYERYKKLPVTEDDVKLFFQLEKIHRLKDDTKS